MVRLLSLAYVPLYGINRPTAAWGLTIAAREVSLPLRDYAEKFVIFSAGAMLLHSAACVLNDICDVDFDCQVGEMPSAVACQTQVLTSCRAYQGPTATCREGVYDRRVDAVSLASGSRTLPHVSCGLLQVGVESYTIVASVTH